jgi:hypothetical protein
MVSFSRVHHSLLSLSFETSFPRGLDKFYGFYSGLLVACGDSLILVSADLSSTSRAVRSFEKRRQAKHTAWPE